MRRLIIHGDAGIRKGGRIRYDGEEFHLFTVTRNGDWHGPSEVQLWCIIGQEDELETFQRREFIPHFLETERVFAEEIEVIQAAGELAV